MFGIICLVLLFSALVYVSFRCFRVSHGRLRVLTFTVFLGCLSYYCLLIVPLLFNLYQTYQSTELARRNQQQLFLKISNPEYLIEQIISGDDPNPLNPEYHLKQLGEKALPALETAIRKRDTRNRQSLISIFSQIESAQANSFLPTLLSVDENSDARLTAIAICRRRVLPLCELPITQVFLSNDVPRIERGDALSFLVELAETDDAVAERIISLIDSNSSAFFNFGEVIANTTANNSNAKYLLLTALSEVQVKIPPSPVYLMNPNELVIALSRFGPRALPNLSTMLTLIDYEEPDLQQDFPAGFHCGNEIPTTPVELQLGNALAQLGAGAIDPLTERLRVLPKRHSSFGTTLAVALLTLGDANPQKVSEIRKDLKNRTAKESFVAAERILASDRNRSSGDCRL